MKKKYFAVICTSILAFSLMTGCSGAQSAGAPSQKSAPATEQNTASVSGNAGQDTAVMDNAAAADDHAQNSANIDVNGDLITEDKAIKTALAKVSGATESDVRIHRDTEDGQPVYEGSLVYDNTEYDFEINAQTGDIIKWESELLSGGGNVQNNSGNNNNKNNNTNNNNSEISENKAIKIALAKVSGATKSNVRIHRDTEDGQPVYEGSIIYNEMEYDFEIDATTGNINEWESESIYDD